jgi:hypothetical protein
VRWADFDVPFAGSLEGRPGDGGRLAACEKPAGRGGGRGDADDHQDEVEHRYPTQIVELV